MLCEGWYRISIVWRFRMDRRERFQYAVWTRIFLKTEDKNVRFQKISGYVWAGGGGVLLGILGGGVPPGSPKPDPISDQKMSFSTPVFRPDL